MSEHRVAIEWSGGSAEFTYDTYPRDHLWTFEGGIEVPATAAPDFKGTEGLVDPEEAFVASVASCHMLTFLAVAARKRFDVESYRDAAVGYLEKNDEGKLAMTRVELSPEIVFGSSVPDKEQLEKLHESAHRNCFIANSVTTSVVIQTH
jgi:organic hydroperoxide reductase OsmC/OhrA